MCSILSQRLLEYIVSLSILHKSQIGFLPNNRTADHVFTLRTLIDKYVHNHNEKIYACFVDFKKAFDSVWHDGLLNKLLQIDVGGSFYNLIKSLYHNSSCSIKIAQKQTRSFRYARGVRQGCIISPLLFKLYINDLPFASENTLSSILLPSSIFLCPSPQFYYFPSSMFFITLLHLHLLISIVFPPPPPPPPPPPHFYCFPSSSSSFLLFSLLLLIFVVFPPPPPPPHLYCFPSSSSTTSSSFILFSLEKAKRPKSGL